MKTPPILVNFSKIKPELLLLNFKKYKIKDEFYIFYSGAAYDNFSNGMAGLIFETSGNSIWTFQNVDYPINSISSYSDSIVFAVGDSGYIVTNKDLQTNISKYYLNENKIHVFPNPSQNEIVIVYESEFIVGKEIEILNNLGQVVFHQKYSISEKMIVNIVEFPIGIYFIKVSDESGIIGIKKVTKT